MTEEELKTKGRLAGAVLAGSALTAGMFGAGIAPAAADLEDDPEENLEDSGPEDITDDTGEEGGDESGGADDGEGDEDTGDDEDAGGDDADADDPANDADPEDTEGEDVEIEDDEEDEDAELPVVSTPAPTEREDVNPEFDEFLIVDEQTPIYDVGSEVIGYVEAGSYLQYYSSESNDPSTPGTQISVSDPYLEEALGESLTFVSSDAVSEYDVEFEEVTPEEPARDQWNTVTIPEEEGITYYVDEEPVSGEVQVPRDGLTVTAEPDAGYTFPDDAETWFSYQYTLTFDDLPDEVEQPEDWEADQEAWYSNAPESNLPEYSGDIRELGWSVYRNTEENLQHFEGEAPVYASPDLDSELLGGLLHITGEEYWWGYLHESDFWMFWHQPTGAVGFVPGESYLGDEDLDDPGDGDVPPGNEEEDDQDDTGDDASDDEDDTDGSDDDSADQDDEDSASDESDSEGSGSDDASEDEGEGDRESADEDQAGDEPETVELALDVDEVAPGDDVTLYAQGFEPEEDVEVTLNPTLDVLPANADGEFTAVVTIPEDTEPGEYELTVTGQDSGISGSAPITVVVGVDPAGDVTVEPDDATYAGGESAAGGSAGGPSEELAATGAEQRTGVIAGVLLAVGAGLVAFANRARLFGRRES